MKVRERKVSVDPEFERYVDACAALFPATRAQWDGMIFHLRRNADTIAQPIMGDCYAAKVRLSRNAPDIRVLFKMSQDVIHIFGGEFHYDKR